MSNDELFESMAAHADEMKAAADTTQLQELGEKAWLLDQKLTKLKAEVSVTGKVLTEMLEKQIPAAMTEAGLPEFGFDTPGGSRARLETSTKVFGTLNNAPDQEEAVAYLEASGFSGGVKTVLSVDYTEEERDIANNLADLIANSGDGREAHVTRTIHPGTLVAWCRSMLKDDPTWDIERVGVRAYPASKFTKR